MKIEVKVSCNDRNNALLTIKEVMNTKIRVAK